MLADVGEEVDRTISVEALPVDLAIVALVSGRMDRIGGSIFTEFATAFLAARVNLVPVPSPYAMVWFRCRLERAISSWLVR